jgi:hypothetical protein
MKLSPNDAARESRTRHRVLKHDQPDSPVSVIEAAARCEAQNQAHGKGGIRCVDAGSLHVLRKALLTPPKTVPPEGFSILRISSPEDLPIRRTIAPEGAPILRSGSPEDVPSRRTDRPEGLPILSPIAPEGVLARNRCARRPPDPRAPLGPKTVCCARRHSE